MDALEKSLLSEADQDNSDQIKQLKKAFHDAHKRVVRNRILEKGLRPDGRSLDEVTPDLV